MRGILLISLAVFIIGCDNKNNHVNQEVTKEVIDSCWYVGPGQINTLQNDFYYFGKTNSGRIVKNTGRHYTVGDTISIVTLKK